MKNIKVYKDTVNQRPKKIEMVENRLKEYRKNSYWTLNDDSTFPEQMYFIFKEYLKRKKSKDNKIDYLDVGAAEGVYISAVTKIFNDSKVTIIAFEPEDERLEVLLENLNSLCASTHDVEVYQNIVAAETSNSFILREFTTSDFTKPAGSSTIVKWDKDNRVIVENKYQSIKLDDFVDKIENLDCIKIDVEGGELEVLKGSLKLLEKTKPVIFLELHCGERFGSLTIDSVQKVLDSGLQKYKFKFLSEHYENKLDKFGNIKKETILEYYILHPVSEDN